MLCNDKKDSDVAIISRLENTLCWWKTMARLQATSREAHTPAQGFLIVATSSQLVSSGHPAILHGIKCSYLMTTFLTLPGQH